jgi:hypothetical protein
MGVSVTVAVPVFDGSLLLVAVIVDSVFVTGEGAIYIPVVLIVPVEADQDTPALVESFTTVGVKVCAAPATRVAVDGDTITLIAGGATVLFPAQPAKKAAAASPVMMRIADVILTMTKCPKHNPLKAKCTTVILRALFHRHALLIS